METQNTHPPPKLDKHPDEVFYRVPGFRHILMSRSGIIFNTKIGRYLTKPKAALNWYIQHTKPGDEKKSYFPMRVAIAACFVPLPMWYRLPHDYEKLDVIHLDGDKTNYAIENLEWAIKPDFDFLFSEAAGNNRIFKVPSFPSLAVSRMGDVYSLYTGTKLSVSVNGFGYCSVSYHVDNGATRTMRLHRLLGEVFVPLKEGYEIESLTINHIDGVKTNNSIENLEWVTPGENVIHAHETGLGSSNKIFSIDRDGNRVYHVSVKKASRMFSIRAHWIRKITLLDKPHAFRFNGICFIGSESKEQVLTVEELSSLDDFIEVTRTWKGKSYTIAGTKSDVDLFQKRWNVR